MVHTDDDTDRTAATSTTRPRREARNDTTADAHSNASAKTRATKHADTTDTKYPPAAAASQPKNHTHAARANRTTGASPPLGSNRAAADLATPNGTAGPTSPSLPAPASHTGEAYPQATPAAPTPADGPKVSLTGSGDRAGELVPGQPLPSVLAKSALPWSHVAGSTPRMR